MNIAFFITPKNQVTYLYDDFTVRQCLEKMRFHGYAAIPVIDRQGHYVGTISEGDLLWRLIGGNGVPVRVLYTPGWIGVYVLFIVLVSLIQGYLPAWIGTRLPAISVVKGEFRTKSKHVFSKVFIVLQQVFSVVLLALAIVMGLQVSHMADRPLGADVDGDFYVQMNDGELQQLFAEKPTSA